MCRTSQGARTWVSGCLYKLWVSVSEINGILNVYELYKICMGYLKYVWAI